MKHKRTILLLALCTILIACGAPDFSYRGENGRISLNGNLLTLHADGEPDAAIASSGDLTISGKTLPLSLAQRGLLMLYFQGVADIRDQANGMEAGVTAAKNAIVDQPGPEAKPKLGTAVEAQAHQLSLRTCQDEVNLASVQDQLNAQIPAFRPYGRIFRRKQASECSKP